MNLITLLAAVTSLAALPDYPAPAPPKGDSAYGTGIQRTMTLLTTSTPEKPNRVRILFYGQSITEQKWWRDVADDLRRRFPHADLQIENRAIGGFASQLLVKTAEADLYPFYPDLVIFHVYGSHVEYENIIKRIRERTTAEVLMQSDHVNTEADLVEETDPAKLRPDGSIWNAFMNNLFLPTTAKRYGAELADIRGDWKEYLRANNLKPQQLLSDGVHLNDHGSYLMAELVKRRLRYRPDLPTDRWKDLVRTYEVGRDIKPDADRVTLEFEGNRVDLIASTAGTVAQAADILIDGKKPSEFPGVYAFTRASTYPGTIWPGLLRVSSTALPLTEEWTARITEGSDDLKSFKFQVVGSKTGPDGEGASDKPFVSRSGRVAIDPADWGLARSREFTRKPLPLPFDVKWSVVPMFQDTYARPPVEGRKGEVVSTVAQGLPNGKHQLEIHWRGGAPPFRAIRVYNPPQR